jgi:hypothetical protein
MRPITLQAVINTISSVDTGDDALHLTTLPESGQPAPDVISRTDPPEIESVLQPTDERGYRRSCHAGLRWLAPWH